VLETGGAQERTLFAEQLDNQRVRLEDSEVRVGKALVSAVKLGVALASGVVDVLDFGEVVALAGVEVVDAVGRGRVDGSCALLRGDVVGGDAKDAAV